MRYLREVGLRPCKVSVDHLLCTVKAIVKALIKAIVCHPILPHAGFLLRPALRMSIFVYTHKQDALITR